MSAETRLLVGLGNPGAKYEATRHNIGFRLIDAIASHYGAPAFKARFQGLFTEFRLDGRKVLLLKPQTYMNESGRSVGPTRMLTLPTSSASSRFFTRRAVSFDPSRPASGEVLMPIVIDSAGSSTVMTGSCTWVRCVQRPSR